MSAIVLFQHGSKALDPRTGSYYDPWKNHIFDTLDQIRLWNKDLPVYFIVDAKEIPDAHEFSKRTVTLIEGSSVVPERDLRVLSDYYRNDRNPLWRSSLIRFFYIEQLMKNMGLTSVFTFDNDVLIYTDLKLMSSFFSEMYTQNAITRIDQNGLICSMMWIRDQRSIQNLNDGLLAQATAPSNKNLAECNLLNLVWKFSGDSLIGSIPIWFDGLYSEGCSEMGGFFDPATIGQYLGGCHNGSPKYHIMTHHEIGPRLKQMVESGSHRILRLKDQENRAYYAFVSAQNNQEVKLNSLHIHSKRMKEFMSNV